MMSDVNGTGSFAVRSKLEGRDVVGYKACQSVSARYGDLDQSRIIKFSEYSAATTEYNYLMANIDSQDAIYFVGKSYSDISRFQNRDDSIQEYISAGAISKASRFKSQYLRVSINDSNDTKTLYNNYAVYNINTKFVGSSDLHAVTNSTDIMQSYIGQITLNRTIYNQFMSNDTFVQDHWLPCCSSSYVPDGSRWLNREAI